MSQDMLKVRVVINEGGENQSDLEAPLKPVSGVEQAQVMRALQSGKMNETSDSYAIEEKYTYNYSRIFGAFFLIVAFFVVATSYFVGRSQSLIPTENSLPPKDILGTKSPALIQPTQEARVVTAIPVNEGASTGPVVTPPVVTPAVTARSEAVQSPGEAVQSQGEAVQSQSETTVTSVASAIVSDAAVFASDAAVSVSGMTATSMAHKIANIGNVQTRILEPSLAMNPTFLGSMIKKEPGIPLASQIPFDENHLIRVFFYVETKNLKGKWLRQHWYHQDKKMATVTSFVNANAFKAHSSKFIRHNWAGNWQVIISVVDQPNQIETKERKLVEGQFDVGVSGSH